MKFACHNVSRILSAEVATGETLRQLGRITPLMTITASSHISLTHCGDQVEGSNTSAGVIPVGIPLGCKAVAWWCLKDKDEL